MFDIGWTEIVVVVMVACLMLEVKDLPKIIRSIKQAANYIGDLTSEVKTFFIDLEKETKTIIDLDGIEQMTYDLDHMKPDIKDQKSNAQTKQK